MTEPKYQRARAVVCRTTGEPVVVEEIDVEYPRRGEVMIKMAACGICHSDAMTSISATMLGRMWMVIMRRSEYPSARQASM